MNGNINQTVHIVKNLIFNNTRYRMIFNHLLVLKLFQFGKHIQNLSSPYLPNSENKIIQIEI